MDENINNNQENEHKTIDRSIMEDIKSDILDREKAINAGAEEFHREHEYDNNANINNFLMDENGNIRNARNGAAAIQSNPNTMLILGWISAALTAFVTPYFAIPGIIFGAIANRQAKGKGSAIIVINIILAAINIVFSMFLVNILRDILRVG